MSLEQQVSELTTDNEKLQRELAKLAKAESQIDEMTAEQRLLQEEIKQLLNEINTHKQAKISFEQHISELTADNEKLQCVLPKFVKAESKIDEMTTEHRLLQEEIKELQNEITKHEQTKLNFEQQVSELTADKENLQCELPKLAKAESQIDEMTAEQGLLQEKIKQLQNEIIIHNQVRENFEQQVSELTADNKKLQHSLAKFEKTESQNKQNLKTLEKLQEEIKKLQNEITIHKQAMESYEQQVSELTADNKKLQCELTKLEKAESKIAEMTAAFRQLKKEVPQVEQRSEHQIVSEPAVKAPVGRKTARRNKINKQQHRTVKGVRQKLCRKCNKWKPESEFHKNSSSKDNLAVSCKICKNKAARERRKRQEAAQR